MDLNVPVSCSHSHSVGDIFFNIRAGVSYINLSYLLPTLPQTNYPGYSHHLKLLTQMNVAHFCEGYGLIWPIENDDKFRMKSLHS